MFINAISCQPLKSSTCKMSIPKQNVAFGNSIENKIVDFLVCENWTKYRMTFEDARKMYEYLGHSVTTKKGALAKVVVAGQTNNLPLGIPNKSENRIGILDLKRLRLMLTGYVKEAYKVH